MIFIIIVFIIFLNLGTQDAHCCMVDGWSSNCCVIRNVNAEGGYPEIRKDIQDDI